MGTLLCRVCAGTEVDSRLAGQYAEFFSLRVATSKDPHLLYSRHGLLGVTGGSFVTRASRRVARLIATRAAKQPAAFMTSISVCRHCHSGMPTHEWAREDLMGFYKDYRADSYNRDRSSVEPRYARIAQRVGEDSAEIRARNAGVEAFLRRTRLELFHGDMVDYGGSDGRFLTPLLLERFDRIFIVDPSGAPLHRSVQSAKVRSIGTAIPQGYDFLACMHVLEHVGNPRAFLMEALEFVKPGGLLYVEVPHEMNDPWRVDFHDRIIDEPFYVHEHINQFDRFGIPAMAASTDLVTLIDAEEQMIDIGWTAGKIGRFLLQKAGSPP